MNPHVSAISGRLSLRPPQRQSLEVLSRITELIPPGDGTDVADALTRIQAEFPSVTDFERDFPSFCFALATGVGKTRLMGASVAYLHLAHGVNNFFVLAPSLTIYNKLIQDFTPNTPKYVFKGIAEFATRPPEVITGDNYDQRSRAWLDLMNDCRINIFNISKINSEVRGGKSPRIKRLSEIIGESYFDYLAALPDLVLLMDESHRYRASAGVRAINELKPVLGLEFTATPFVETGKAPAPFRNVVVDYPLGKAMADGFVKEPAVVTRKNFNPAGMSADALERLKLEDGVRLHEQTKVVLETYAREWGHPIVKPFVLVIARDTTHAGQLIKLIQDDEFFEGRYRNRVIQVDSSKTGPEEDAMVERLIRVEDPHEPTEIVIHVNMLKEGWDVTNLYTIVPLRAANARTLIEQSIGRGLRLPYGKRTGVAEVDRLSIVAHDRFQEIIDEANRPESAIRVQAIILDETQITQKTKTVVSQPTLENELGITPAGATASTDTPAAPPTIFKTPEEQAVARVAYDVIKKLANNPAEVPSAAHLDAPETRAKIVNDVREAYRPAQMPMPGIIEEPDFEKIVAKTTALVVQRTIDIPRIIVVPRGEVKSGFNAFTLELNTLRFPAPDAALWLQYLRTGKSEEVGLGAGGIDEPRLENYVVRGLVDFNDIAYDSHADLLYDLATQTVAHFRTYLSEDDTKKVLQLHQREIGEFIHAQMDKHYWEADVEHDISVKAGFSELKPSAYTVPEGQPLMDVNISPTDKTRWGKYLFGPFERCLYPVQKFESDPERTLAVILERDSQKWFRPARGQFQIFYKVGRDHQEYQPDFVTETSGCIYMLEAKARSDMTDVEVLAKKDAAEKWCALATDHAKSYGGKPWRYALIAHDVIAENMTIEGLTS